MNTEQTTTRASYRGTKSQLAYILASNDIASLEQQLKAAKTEEKRLRPVVLAELDGSERQVREPRSRRIYTLTPDSQQSIGQVDQDATVAHCLASGLDAAVKHRSAVVVEPATFRKLFLDGLLPIDLAKITTEQIVIVK